MLKNLRIITMVSLLWHLPCTSREGNHFFTLSLNICPVLFPFPHMTSPSLTFCQKITTFFQKSKTSAGKGKTPFALDGD